MSRHTRSNSPPAIVLDEVSLEVVGQQLSVGVTHDAVRGVTEERIWEALQATPNLQRFVLERSAELAPVDLAARGVAVRAMLDVIGLYHELSEVTSLEQLLQIEA